MTARHAATTPRRRFPMLLAAATLLGLWFGVAAPEVSPVSPPVPASEMQTVDDTTADVPQPDARR